MWQIRYDPSHIHSGLIHWYADGRLYMTGENLRVFSRGGGPLNGLTVTVACDSWLRRSRLSLDTRPARNTAWSYGSAGRMETVSQGGATVTCQCVANATAVLHKGATPPYNAPWLQGWTRWIAPQTIQLGDLGPVGGDGFLYKVLPDGETFDFTPRVKHKEFYHFGVGQQKHKLRLAANGYVLEPDKVVAGAAFCVGQKVTFTAQWDPALVGVSSNAYDWVMSTKYVNHSWQHCRYDEFGNAIYYGSVNYDTDPEVRKLAAPWAWWVTGGDKNVKLDLTVHFDNGQSGRVSEKGKFGMHRPTVTMMPFSPEESYRQFFTTSYGLACKLQYGADNESGSGQMRYRVKILTGCKGDAGITQICDLDYSNPAFQCVGRLDGNKEFYNDTQRIWVQANHLADGNVLMFFDGPWNKWTSPNRLKGHFRDYVRFRPTGSESIYVTLGIVTWDMHAVAERIEFSGVWELTTDVHPAPVGPDSDDTFPEWTEVIED